jgi:hypothetical protein
MLSVPQSGTVEIARFCWGFYEVLGVSEAESFTRPGSALKPCGSSTFASIQRNA